METSLRPLSLSEILDRTAQLYRTNFILFAGIFAGYCGIGLVLNLLLIRPAGAAESATINGDVSDHRGRRRS